MGFVQGPAEVKDSTFNGITEILWGNNTWNNFQRKSKSKIDVFRFFRETNKLTGLIGR